MGIGRDGEEVFYSVSKFISIFQSFSLSPLRCFARFLFLETTRRRLVRFGRNFEDKSERHKFVSAQINEKKIVFVLNRSKNIIIVHQKTKISSHLRHLQFSSMSES